MRKFILSSVMLAAVSMLAEDASGKVSWETVKTGAQSVGLKAKNGIVSYAQRAKGFFVKTLKGKEKTDAVRGLEELKKGLDAENKLRLSILNEFVKMFKVFEDKKAKSAKVIQVRLGLISQFGAWAGQIDSLHEGVARENIYNLLLVVRSTLDGIKPDKSSEETQDEQIKRQSAKAILSELDKAFPHIISISQQSEETDNDSATSESAEGKKHHRHHHRHHHSHHGSSTNNSYDEGSSDFEDESVDEQLPVSVDDEAPASDAAPDIEEESTSSRRRLDRRRSTSDISAPARNHSKLSRYNSTSEIRRR